MKNKIKTKYKKIKNNKIFPRVPERSEILLKCQNTQKHLRVSTSITSCPLLLSVPSFFGSSYYDDST